MFKNYKIKYLKLVTSLYELFYLFELSTSEYLQDIIYFIQVFLTQKKMFISRLFEFSKFKMNRILKTTIKILILSIGLLHIYS